MLFLPDYLAKAGLSMAQFAQKIGVSREAVRGWCGGEYSPSLQRIKRIEEITEGEVTARSFYRGRDHD